MKHLFILFLLLTVMACDKDRFIGYNAELVNNLQYYKDKRTGLCFVKNSFTGGGQFASTAYVFVQVPCTPEVEKLIEK